MYTPSLLGAFKCGKFRFFSSFLNILRVITTDVIVNFNIYRYYFNASFESNVAHDT